MDQRASRLFGRGDASLPASPTAPPPLRAGVSPVGNSMRSAGGNVGGKPMLSMAKIARHFDAKPSAMGSVSLGNAGWSASGRRSAY
jgi:hypothetical protein